MTGNEINFYNFLTMHEIFNINIVYEFRDNSVE